MDTNSYSIFDFLKYCGGSWRNTLYVPCGVCIHPCRAEQRGALVVADGYGRPRAISVVRYEQGSGLIRTNASVHFSGTPLIGFSKNLRFGNVSTLEIVSSAAWTARFPPGRCSGNRKQLWNSPCSLKIGNAR